MQFYGVLPALLWLLVFQFAKAHSVVGVVGDSDFTVEAPKISDDVAREMKTETFQKLLAGYLNIEVNDIRNIDIKLEYTSEGIHGGILSIEVHDRKNVLQMKKVQKTF